MPNKKITELNYNTNPTLQDVFPVVNSGETKQLSLSGLTELISPYIDANSDFSQLGFIVTPNTIEQDVNLPEDSTIRYFGPLTMGSGNTINVPTSSTLIIL